MDLATYPEEVLARLESESYIYSKDPSIDYQKCRKPIKASLLRVAHSYFSKKLELNLQIEQTFANILSGSSAQQLFDIWGTYAKATKVCFTINDIDILVTQQKSVHTKYKNIIRILKYLKEEIQFFEIADEVSEQTHKSLEKFIDTYKKTLTSDLLGILQLLRRNFSSKRGIGKGVEGYIPFITWARGSIRAQLVNNLSFIDKLSQLNKMEITNGY